MRALRSWFSVRLDPTTPPQNFSPAQIEIMGERAGWRYVDVPVIASPATTQAKTTIAGAMLNHAARARSRAGNRKPLCEVALETATLT